MVRIGKDWTGEDGIGREKRGKVFYFILLF